MDEDQHLRVTALRRKICRSAAFWSQDTSWDQWVEKIKDDVVWFDLNCLLGEEGSDRVLQSCYEHYWVRWR